MQISVTKAPILSDHENVAFIFIYKKFWNFLRFEDFHCF